MRLLVQEPDGITKEFRISGQLVRLGRAPDNDAPLPHLGVSRHHAELRQVDSNKWTVKDLGSSNKTYLNDQPITESQIHTGDHLQIAGFAIEVDLENGGHLQSELHMTDTLHGASLDMSGPETIVRKPDAAHAPAIRLRARRLTEFPQAVEAIERVETVEKLMSALLRITSKQFGAFHCWCGIREQPSGPMTYEAGRRSDGQTIALGDIKLKDKITQTLDRQRSLVIPRTSVHAEEKEGVRSAMMAAIVRPSGCLGVLYVDNAMVREPYGLGDLDYLMFIAIYTGSVLGRLLDV
jgi:hypothetical protein